ncbi:MAG TPA: alanine--tRNA ligase [Candidatus Paceibacterota bacterium]|nr:alanine--tRNA ligase [Candidatus Paceibacterota bacterium]
MTLSEVRSRYLAFFAARGHKIIPSASLVPENDPTTLFTSSGMQPLVPYLLGQPHPEGKRIVNSQKCFRADDIDEVGDNRHTTFFEMLGNWSLGDYFKADQLTWFFEFLTDTKDGIGLNPMNLYVTVFAGDSEMEIPADDESVKIWKELFLIKEIDAKYVQLGSEANGSAMGMQGGRIFSYDVKKNWWSRAGVPSKMPAGEPGGPDSEVFYDFGEKDESGRPRHDVKFGAQCHPNCDCGRFLEIGNSVFMEYKKREDGSFEKLAQRNVDFGGGLERITAASIADSDIFHIDVFKKMSDTLDFEGAASPATLKEVRIILDHMRAAIFLIADGVQPANKGQGYVLRRLLRRVALFGRTIFGPAAYREKILGIVPVVAELYGQYYEDVAADAAMIRREIEVEFGKFDTVVGLGLKEVTKILDAGTITGKDAFNLLQTYGFPWELTQEIAEKNGVTVDRAAFEEEFKKHRDLSRTASAGTFKGGLADNSEKTVRLHTAHHLLLRALQIVLGPTVKQRGSNITSERLRLDYLHNTKLTDEQKKEVERIVNEKIAEDLPVIRSEMAREDAEKLGAEHEFGQKYPERVSVYSIGPKGATLEKPQFDKAFSIEFCGGPHVEHTGVIGHFTITKEEAVAAGIRRIRGVIE